MFRTVPLSIISSFSVYTQQWFMSYSFADSLLAGSGRNVLILLASCQQSCLTYTIAACTVKNSWWWTEKLSETCRVLFQKLTWEISASSWFYYKNIIFITPFYARVLRCISYLSEVNYKHRNNVRWYVCLISSTVIPKLYNGFQNNFVLFRTIDSPCII